MTPLHVAAEKAHNDVMEVLHKHGAKVNISKYVLWEKARGRIISVKYSVRLHDSSCLVHECLVLLIPVLNDVYLTLVQHVQECHMKTRTFLQII